MLTPHRKPRNVKVISPDEIAFPPLLDTEEFRSLFWDWVLHRQHLKTPGTPWKIFFEKQLRRLAGKDDPNNLTEHAQDLLYHQACVTVAFSTEQGYTGLYAAPRGWTTDIYRRRGAEASQHSVDPAEIASRERARRYFGAE